MFAFTVAKHIGRNDGYGRLDVPLGNPGLTQPLIPCCLQRPLSSFPRMRESQRLCIFSTTSDENIGRDEAVG